MRIDTLLKRWTALFVALTITIGVVSCGTIFYPERRGQPGGKVDVNIALLDSIGLLLFIVPGVIAFAVDFSTGAIYLPPDSSEFARDPVDLEASEKIHMAARPLTRVNVEALIEETFQQQIDLTAPGTKVAKIESGKVLSWKNITQVLTPEELIAFHQKNG